MRTASLVLSLERRAKWEVLLRDNTKNKLLTKTLHSLTLELVAVRSYFTNAKKKIHIHIKLTSHIQLYSDKLVAQSGFRKDLLQVYRYLPPVCSHVTDFPTSKLRYDNGGI